MRRAERFLRSTLRTRRGWCWLGLLVFLQALPSGAVWFEPTVLDDFEPLQGWSATASEGTEVSITEDAGYTGKGMRIGFDLNPANGYVIVRKTFSLPLPENYAFTFYLRGEDGESNFEFKLIGPGGRSVWWQNYRNFRFPAEWRRITIRKSRIKFAWGTSRRTDLDHITAIEFAVSSGSGGRGAVWIDELAFGEREPVSPGGVVFESRASSFVRGNEPSRLVDSDPATEWRSEALPGDQWVLLDLQGNREYGGLVIDWDENDYATAYEVKVSNDALRWETVYASTTGNGGRDYIFMPDAESRFLRLDLQQSSHGMGYAIAALAIKPFEFSASPNSFFEAIAREAPVGTYPKYFYGKQSYWTVVGVDGDDNEGLLNEEGMIEAGTGAFSVEPFLHTGGKLVTWDSVEVTQELEDGDLPIPLVTWRHGHFTLKITAFAAGKPGDSVLYAKYRVENQGNRRERLRLFLTVRPFQVSPPWQSLNMVGGVTSIQNIGFDGRTVRVNQDRQVVSLTRPDAFGAAVFEDGSVTDFLVEGTIPARTEVSDPFGFASGVLQYDLDLKPGQEADVYLAMPFGRADGAAFSHVTAEEAPSFVARQHEEVRRYWRKLLGRVEIDLPPQAKKVTQTLRTNLAYILINRDGPAIQPGSRNYARSWIRDGALTSEALLQMGITTEVRNFLQWFAGYQFENGKVPCCVDRRGADPVSENDSHGQLIYGVRQYYRFTRDVGFLSDMWPHVVAAVGYMSSLRQKRLTAEFKEKDKQVFYGLLPESISHEGYASHPVHSYWDDFFALKGFSDAAEMAVIVGDDEHAKSFATLRDAFRLDLAASISRAMAMHKIDYVPGSAELGDFDPTSTAIALILGEELTESADAAFRNTLDKYYDDFDRRRRGQSDADGYAPYELRNVEALVRLGQRARAVELLNFFLGDLRPASWNQWTEIAWRDANAPRFIGDMPHTWVGSCFIRSVRSMFAYEDDSDRTLVIGAGLPAEWLTSESGVAVRRLPTHYGTLNYSFRGEPPGPFHLRLSGDLALPPGNIVVKSPLDQPLKAVSVNGKPLDAFSPDSATIGEFPADVVLEY